MRIITAETGDVRLVIDNQTKVFLGININFKTPPTTLQQIEMFREDVLDLVYKIEASGALQRSSLVIIQGNLLSMGTLLGIFVATWITVCRTTPLYADYIRGGGVLQIHGPVSDPHLIRFAGSAKKWNKPSRNHNKNRRQNQKQRNGSTAR